MLPHVLRWLIGLATSLVGNHIYLVTLAWVAVQTTTPVNVGLILVAGAIPQAALLLVGGVFVDRIGPKPTIIASDVLRTLIMVVFAIVVAGGDVSPLLLATLAVMFGLVDGFFLPAINTAPGTWCHVERSPGSSRRRRSWPGAPNSSAHPWAAGCWSWRAPLRRSGSTPGCSLCRSSSWPLPGWLPQDAAGQVAAPNPEPSSTSPRCRCGPTSWRVSG